MKKAISLCILCIITALRVMAQTGDIKVIVTAGNSPVEDVIVTISSQNVKDQKTTDTKGVATFRQLLTGNYTITASKAGFSTKTAYTTVISGKTQQVNIQLAVVLEELKAVTISEKELHIRKDKRRATKTVQEDMARGRTIEYEAMPAPADAMYAPASMPRMAYRERNTESYKKVPENDFMSVRVNPLSTMSVDVDRASYANVRRFINEGQTPPPDAVRVEEMINYFNYQYPQPEGDNPLAIVTELTNCPWNDKHKLLHIGMQARTIPTDNLPPSNLVFLIDVSGSMDQENKLPLVKSSLKMLISKLRALDRISIVVYAGSAGLVLPATAGNQKGAINAALNKLKAGGSTAGGAGIKLAYNIAQENYIRGGNNRVILATDGDFNVGVSGDNEMEELITKERQKGIYLTCLGYGMGNYKDSKMEVLADKGNGNYAYIDSKQEAEKTLVREFGGTIFTLAKDVKSQIEFNPAYVQSYRLVGYENRLLNEEDFTDDKKDAGDMGSGHSVTIIYEIIPAGVNSADVRNVRPLKYQQRAAYPTVLDYEAGSELATIKFRYKKPNGNTSKEITHLIYNNSTDIRHASENARFATSVAMFGMLLKNSAYKGTSNYNKVLTMARNSAGYDAEGYRAEFIELVKKVSKPEEVAMNKWYEEEE